MDPNNSMQRREFLAAGAGALALAASGCASAERPTSDDFSWRLHPPQAAGLDPAGLPRIRAAIQQHIDNASQTGAVTAFARNNKLVWFEAQGVRNVDTGEAMRRDDIFRMMSSTKNVTSVAVMMMADEGRLDIDHPVSRYLPSFTNPRVAVPPEGWQRALADPSLKAEITAQMRIVPADREITIKDLLTHTSGLSSWLGSTPVGPATLVNEAATENARINTETTLADRIPKLGEFVLDFQPGSRWGYSGLDGMDTLLHIVELVSGQEADSFLTERVFAPLEMHDTYFNVPSEKQSRVLTLYERHDNAWRQATPMFGTGPLRYISGAGGLLSTAHDFLNFELMLLNRGTFNGRRLLRPETVSLMSTNHVGALFAEWIPPITSGMGFGLGCGIVLEPDVVNNGRGRGAFGWGGAYGTESWADPENNVAGVYLVQQSGNSASRDYQRAIRDALV